MDLESTVTNVGAVLFVVGVFVALWRRRFSENRITRIGALLAIAGFAFMVSSELLL